MYRTQTDPMAAEGVDAVSCLLAPMTLGGEHWQSLRVMHKTAIGAFREVLDNAADAEASLTVHRVAEGAPVEVWFIFDSAGNLVEIWVKDNGTGMTEKVLRRSYFHLGPGALQVRGRPGRIVFVLLFPPTCLRSSHPSKLASRLPDSRWRGRGRRRRCGRKSRFFCRI